ncbi:MAG TPA: S41 family peptidase, partial [Candidatus Cloacimonas sp.]|nr:S41 family peptidase [Candidatus Cloacimonas sp.]
GRWYFKYDDYYRHQKIAIADSGFLNIRPINTPWAVTTNFAFNADGSYAVYGTIREDNYIKELYLYDVQADTSKRLLADNGWWQNLFWTPDNKSILLTYNNNIYRLDLVPRDEFELDTDPWKEILHPEKSKPDSTNEELQNEEEDIQEFDITLEEKIEKKTKPLEIVWEGLEKRFYPVITAKDNYNFVLDIISDSTFYYIEDNKQQDKNSILKKTNIYGKNQKDVFNFGKNPQQYSKVKNTIYYLVEGELKSYNLKTSSRKDIKFKYDYKYDKALLNLRVFEEVWYAFGNNFYDPDMHNVPWKELFQLYRPYVEKAKNIYDVAFIIEEMIGDVNASHTGFYPRQEYEPFTNPAAWLGADLDYNIILEEGIRLQRVYPNSRLSFVYHLKDGCVLTHIDGVKITAYTSLDSLLAGKIGKKIKVTFQQEGNITEAVITGLSYSQMSELKYDYQIAKNKKMVDELSAGKLGYIHIPAMGEDDWQKFSRDFMVDNFAKEALVIDVRGNYGGHIHDKIITLLQKKKYAYTTNRRYNRVKRSEPYNVWDKPSIVLVNEDSFSDGEIFPAVYQELKLGKVVGTPSSGAVIGTWHYYLQDGSSMRMPGTGWYKLDGTNMEGTGVQPDILVENLPADIIRERDPQLIRAVQELMKEIK